jgi:hypothetical protein
LIILKRGNVVLTQIKTINKNKIFNTKSKELPTNKKDVQPPKKIIVVKTHVIIIFEYSAKKNNAKPIAEYSTLYPETNSASASGKSKGALFVSANEEIKNNKNKPNCGIINQIVS